MKKNLLLAASLILVGLVYAMMPESPEKMVQQKQTAGSDVINWLTWDEAVKANEKKPKKFFIDFYTDWCGWCKRMDATTFSDPTIAKYINQNFHPVKFNAEQKEDVVFKGTTFKWQPGSRGGVHLLAYQLLDGRLGYPSYVYLTPKYERILISPGYKDVPNLQKELKFVAENHYTTISWEQYKNSN